MSYSHFLFVLFWFGLVSVFLFGSSLFVCSFIFWVFEFRESLHQGVSLEGLLLRQLVVLQDMPASWLWEDSDPAGVVSLEPHVVMAARHGDELFSVRSNTCSPPCLPRKPMSRLKGRYQGVRSPRGEIQVLLKKDLLLKDLSSVTHGSPQGR